MPGGVARGQSSWIEDEALYLVTEYCAGGSVSQEAWPPRPPAPVGNVWGGVCLHGCPPHIHDEPWTHESTE